MVDGLCLTAGHGSRPAQFALSPPPVLRRAAVAVLLLVVAACGKPKGEAPTATTQPKGVESATPKPLDVPAPPPPKAEPVVRDLPVVQAEKTLRVLFTFNSTGYFIFRGETLGYEHELLSRFAKAMKLKLVPVVVRDSNTLFELLNRGEGDIVAAQLAAPGNESEVLVTDSLYQTSPVVVQRGGNDETAGHSAATATALEREERETGKSVTVRARLVARPSELAGHNVHISRRSPYRRILLELNDELTDDIHVVEVDESADRLIQRLSEGEIGYTVAAENVAQLKTSEYSNLRRLLADPQVEARRVPPGREVRLRPRHRAGGLRGTHPRPLRALQELRARGTGGGGAGGDGGAVTAIRLMVHG
jgi:hypothetical protein